MGSSRCVGAVAIVRRFLRQDLIFEACQNERVDRVQAGGRPHNTVRLRKTCWHEAAAAIAGLVGGQTRSKQESQSRFCILPLDR